MLHSMVAITSIILAGVSVRSYTSRLHEVLRAHRAVDEVIIIIDARKRRAERDDSNLWQHVSVDTYREAS